MFYDYFLASLWSDYCDKPLEQFAEETYTILRKHQADFPEKSRVILTYMSKYNWLVSYAKKEGLRRALKGLSERMKYYSPMDEAVSELDKNYDLYKNDFEEFFPLVRGYVEQFRKQ